jgi:hypothetical protein
MPITWRISVAISSKLPILFRSPDLSCRLSSNRAHEQKDSDDNAQGYAGLRLQFFSEDNARPIALTNSSLGRDL